MRVFFSFNLVALIIIVIFILRIFKDLFNILFLRRLIVKSAVVVIIMHVLILKEFHESIVRHVISILDKLLSLPLEIITFVLFELSVESLLILHGRTIKALVEVFHIRKAHHSASFRIAFLIRCWEMVPAFSKDLLLFGLLPRQSLDFIFKVLEVLLKSGV